MKGWAVVILALGLCTSVVAQRGGGHGGGMGAGAGSMGAGPGMSGSANSAHGNSGMDNAGASMSRQTADTALTKSPKLSSNLEKLLPNGMTAQQACSGFKNLGGCVAAIHVSHNLNIPFAELKAKMTGSNSDSLGKAIQTLKPEANAKAEAKKAKAQADQDLSGTES